MRRRRCSPRRLTTHILRLNPACPPDVRKPGVNPAFRDFDGDRPVTRAIWRATKHDGDSTSAVSRQVCPPNQGEARRASLAPCLYRNHPTVLATGQGQSPRVPRNRLRRRRCPPLGEGRCACGLFLAALTHQADSCQLFFVSPFFKAQPLAPEEPPDRVPAHRDPCRGQQILQPVDRQMRRLADQRSNQLPVRLQKPASVAADLARRHAPPRPPAGNPFGDRGNADTVTRRHRPDRLARQVGSDNAFAKVIRLSSAHPCWPPSPVASLNNIP